MNKQNPLPRSLSLSWLTNYFWLWVQTCAAMVRRYWQCLTTILLVLITWLSLGDPAEMPAGSLGIDKLQHLTAYAVLAFPVALAKPRYWYLWLLAMLCWSGVIEIIQPLVGREKEAADLLANATGLLAGHAVANLLSKITSSTASHLSDVY